MELVMKKSRFLSAFCLALSVALVTSAWAEGFSFSLPAKIVFEVENGKVKKPFKVIDESGASGGKVVYLKEETNKKSKKRN